MQPKIPVPKGLVLQREVKPKPKKVKKRTLSQKGKWSRQKGHQFERDIAIQFRVRGYPQACRNLEYQQGMGIDIANTGIYDIQCKRKKTHVSVAAIEEVPTKEGRVPLLISKSDYSETYVTMPLNYFFELIKNNNQGQVKHALDE